MNITKTEPLLGFITYNPDAPDGEQIKVVITDKCAGMLSTLTDFELKVFAAEVSLVVRQRFELPPSPRP